MSRFARKSRRVAQRVPDRKLLRRVEQHYGADRKIITHRGAVDGVKMSEVLEDFVAPYMHVTTNMESVKRLYLTGIVAWNLALLPKPERRKELDKLVAALKLDKQSASDMRAIVTDLIERKDKLFAQHRRNILDIEITDTGKSYHLSVVSSAEPVEPSD